MTEAILTINAGSSSIKFALFGRGEPLQPQAALRGEIDGIGAQPRLRAQDAGGAPSTPEPHHPRNRSAA